MKYFVSLFILCSSFSYACEDGDIFSSAEIAQQEQDISQSVDKLMKTKNALFMMDGDGQSYLYFFDQWYYVPKLIPLNPPL